MRITPGFNATINARFASQSGAPGHGESPIQKLLNEPRIDVTQTVELSTDGRPKTNLDRLLEQPRFDVTEGL
jgi:hypothetical protein